jgi:3-phenylpropionate/trans-cinnamate dioxygenase ferredoxin subunit
MQDPPEPQGRNLEALGLCLAESECAEQGHVLARAELPQSASNPTSGHRICVTCTERAGRLDGLRLWHSVCPCCFSSAFPEGVPSLHPHGKTDPPPSQGAHTGPPDFPASTPVAASGPRSPVATPPPTSGSAIRIEVDGEPVAVFNVGGTFYAIGAVCPHEGGPLEEGEVENGEVTCPWHGSVFDLKTGRVLTPPARKDVQAYDVRIEGNSLTVSPRR